MHIFLFVLFISIVCLRYYPNDGVSWLRFSVTIFVNFDRLNEIINNWNKIYWSNPFKNILNIICCIVFNFLTDLSFTELKNQRKKVSSVQHDSRASSRGIIPQAKIRTIKMTFVIILGKHILMQFIDITFNYHYTTNANGAALFISTSYNTNNTMTFDII